MGKAIYRRLQKPTTRDSERLSMSSSSLSPIRTPCRDTSWESTGHEVRTDEEIAFANVRANLPGLKELLRQLTEAVRRMFPRMRPDSLTKIETAATEACVGRLLKLVRHIYASYFKKEDASISRKLRTMRKQGIYSHTLAEDAKGVGLAATSEFKVALRSLRRLRSKGTPLAKASCLVKSFMLLTDAAKRCTVNQCEKDEKLENRVSCDIICEAAQQLLVTSGESGFVWQVHFAKDLMKDEEMGKEGDYVLTTLYGILHVLTATEEANGTTPVDAQNKDCGKGLASP